MFNQALIEKELAEIKAECESAFSVLTKALYIALIDSYQAMLDSSNEVFYTFAKNLSKLEHEIMLKRMSQALLMQYNRPNTNKILILVLQMKQDFENFQHDV